MQRNAKLLAVASACFSVGLASQARAAGFALHEQGASGLGNAYAGAAAVAEDATTVWWNPAGMARLGAGKHFAAAGAYIAPSTKFTNGASQTAALSNPALVSWLAQGGASPAGGTPEAFAHIVRQDSEYYRHLIKAANLRLE